MSMFNKVTKTFQWGQHTVTMETGEIARQSGGAVHRRHRRHRGAGHRGRVQDQPSPARTSSR